jgi:large subunit ribosomal protein L5
MSRLATPIRKNDNVLVITGKDRGKRGRVLKVLPDKNRLVIEGVNMIKRHTKPNPGKNIKGGIVEREASRVERALVFRVRRADARRPEGPRGRPQGSHLPEVRRSRRQMSRLKDKYQKEVVPALTKEFGYKNVMAVPKIEKVVVNMGLGEATSNVKLVDTGADELARITGQRPVTRRAKKSIAAFKVRKGMPIATMVTLRGERMRVPRPVGEHRPAASATSRVSRPRGFDGRGNYTLGLRDQVAVSGNRLHEGRQGAGDERLG